MPGHGKHRSRNVPGQKTIASVFRFPVARVVVEFGQTLVVRIVRACEHVSFTQMRFT